MISQKDRERVERRLFTMYKASAKRRKLEFALTQEEFIGLSFRPCAYCGSEPSNTVEYSGLRLAYIGIDRKNGRVGYRLDNCLPCCSFCNGLRGTMKFETWADFINSVVVNHIDEPFPEVEVDEARPNKRFYKGH